MAKIKLEFTENEMTRKENREIKRYPNLSTVLMVEDLLRKHRDMPMKLSEIKKQLPKQIMHQTLLVILEYLWRSGKIIYGPKGIQWVYSSSEHLKKMLEGSLEV